MFKLCWIHKGWDKFDGLKHCTTHDSIKEIVSIMSKCIYNGEWIEDMSGNKLDIDLREYALT